MVQNVCFCAKILIVKTTKGPLISLMSYIYHIYRVVGEDVPVDSDHRAVDDSQQRGDGERREQILVYVHAVRAQRSAQR